MIIVLKRRNVRDVRDKKRKKISIALRLQHASQTKNPEQQKVAQELINTFNYSVLEIWRIQKL